MWSVRRVDETASTNDDLSRAASAGAPHGSVLVAGHQTAGRGRLDRTWAAPPGSNLLVSVLFRDRLDFPHELVQRVSVAMAQAASQLSGRHVVLKWPNDLLVDANKLAGVLAQSGGQSGRVDWVVVGVGVNVGWAPPGAALLSGVRVDDLLSVWLHELEAGWHLDVLADYTARLATLGQRVRVSMPAGDIEGTAVGVGADGRLTVRAADEDFVVSAGDVTHLRPV